MNSATAGTAARVMDVAEALIQQRGYGGFSFDDVAQAVGIRKPSVHHHFRTKAELVAALARRYTERFESALAAIDVARRDPLARLKAYVQLFASTYAQDGRLCVRHARRRGRCLACRRRRRGRRVLPAQPHLARCRLP